MNNLTINNYQGAIAAWCNHPMIIAQLADIPKLLSSKKVERLSKGADYVVKLPLDTPDGELMVTVKVFKRQNRLKDWYDRHHKSKAERSYLAAIYLQEQNIGTPAPLAWLERWEKERLLESYYVCAYEAAICFRDALAEIYHNDRDNAPLMDLLLAVAPAIRAMHDVGFMHGDMGNQNILLPKTPEGLWGNPQFIDLNRSKITAEPASEKQRAFDLARIALPGAYMKIFKTIYNHHEDFPSTLDKLEQTYRHRFWRHRRNSKWRHPIRYLKNRNKKPSHPTYPEPQDIWLWDEKSAQPMIVLGRKEKHHYRDWTYMLSMLWQGLIALPGLYRHYKRLRNQSYQTPLSMSGRIGVALQPHTNYLATELHLLQQLGNPPVLIRFCHHETSIEWQRSIDLVHQLHRDGVEVMIAILQDRRALLEPTRWKDFLEKVIGSIGDKTSFIEITHASNRLKWGIWSSTEYAQLLAPALALQKRYPHIKLTGPACIDFEYLPVIAALGAIPKKQKLAALSHLLYVDRRGAPENKQGDFSTLEKCTLLKALAQWSEHCEDKVIISEVNWPVKNTGIWSPIGCPYETPKWRREQPGETEEEYANYMLRYLVITLCSGHVERVYWWRLSAHGYGLVDDRDNFRIRPAFIALAFFLRTLGKAEFIRKWNTPERTFVFEFKTDKQTVWMAWALEESDYRPDINYAQALDREGDSLTQINLGSSPIYLFS